MTRKTPRPAEFDDVLQVKMPKAMKHKFIATAESRGETTAQVVREMIAAYNED